jgi:hypothetical protein
VWALYRLAQLPQRPSSLLSLPQAGFSDRVCLSFDLAVAAYGEAFQDAREATIEVPAPKAKKTATVPAPKYKPDDFRRFLGLDPDDGDAEDAEREAELNAMADAVLRGAAEIDWGF